jgi:hypothetical protein
LVKPQVWQFAPVLVKAGSKPYILEPHAALKAGGRIQLKTWEAAASTPVACHRLGNCSICLSQASPFNKSESLMRSFDLLLPATLLGPDAAHPHRTFESLRRSYSYALIFALNLIVVATWTTQRVLRQHPATGPNLRPATRQKQDHRIKNGNKKKPQALTEAHCLETMQVWLPARLLL